MKRRELLAWALAIVSAAVSVAAAAAYRDEHSYRLYLEREIVQQSTALGDCACYEFTLGGAR